MCEALINKRSMTPVIGIGLRMKYQRANYLCLVAGLCVEYQRENALCLGGGLCVEYQRTNALCLGVGLCVEYQRAGGVRDVPQPDRFPHQELWNKPSPCCRKVNTNEQTDGRTK